MPQDNETGTKARETLLFLPGMMCDERLFAPQIHVFSRDYNIHVGEIWGADTLDEIALKILSQVPGNFLNVLGLSMGGIVAMGMIALAPNRIKRLALFDTNHHSDKPERRELRQQQMKRVRDGFLREVIVDELKPHYVAAKNRENTQLLNLLVKMALDLGANKFVQQNQILLSRSDQSENLKTFNGPALVLCGEEDHLCPPGRHEEICTHLVNSDFVLVPDAGHITTLENPEFVNNAIRNWLNHKTTESKENLAHEPT